MGVLRLAHVDVRTPDLELSTAYYTEVLGMEISARTDDSVYLKCWDEEDHHSLRLRTDSRIGMDKFSFRVEREDDLGELEIRLANAGCDVRRVSRGEEVGQGESIQFEIPSGQTLRDPEQSDPDPRAAGPGRLGNSVAALVGRCLGSGDA